MENILVLSTSWSFPRDTPCRNACLLTATDTRDSSEWQCSEQPKLQLKFLSSSSDPKQFLYMYTSLTRGSIIQQWKGTNYNLMQHYVSIRQRHDAQKEGRHEIIHASLPCLQKAENSQIWTPVFRNADIGSKTLGKSKGLIFRKVSWLSLGGRSDQKGSK